MDADLALAQELATVADGMSFARFRAADLRVDTKPDLTPVTEADRAIERRLRELLASRRPDDAILGEEEGASGEAPRRWIIDPIDGTRNYSRGIPVFATLIALECDGVIELGVVSAPALGRRWWAARGAGAYADGQPIHVSRVERIEDAVVSLGAPPQQALAALARRAWHPRGFGDFWQHMLVAEGAVDVAVDPMMSLWDCAALQPIVEEAGGAFSDLTGRPWPDGGSGLSSNGLLHEAVLEALAALSGAS
ncbi:MAG: inositol monophosphatase family protein [Gaiellaceae bacterium]